MSKKFLAFDVGGTTIKYGLVDNQLNISNRGKFDTHHNQDDYILKQLLDISAEFKGNHEIDAIGVSTAGIVGDQGEILYAGPTIPQYQGTQLKAKLVEENNLPTFVVNDVDAALLAELVSGTAQDSKSAYCVALGTGIGGAYAINGKLVSGAHSFANSIGYILYDQKSDTYYEQRASTLALEAKLKEQNVSVIEGFEKAKNNDLACLKIIKDWSYQVAAGLAEVILLFDPEVLVIGGAVCQQGDFLIDLLEEQLQKLVPNGLLKTKLKTATLTDKAQLVGAISPFLK